MPELFRDRARPHPSFAAAVSAGGGAVVAIGVFLVAIDVYIDKRDGWRGALPFVALAVLAIGALFVTPRAVHPGAVSALVLSVPAVYGFLVFPSTDSFADARIFFVLTIATWALLFVVPNSRGRPVLLGLAAALLYVWVVGEVADTDEYFATPEVGVQDAPDAQLAAFGAQETTIDDLDPSDPLYPLAESCASGDLGACDDLWSESDVGSEFEEFAESCGGDPTATFPCDRSTEFDDGFTELEEDPLGVTPLGQQDDKALEIGLVSLLFGAAYLGALLLLDRRGARAIATAFVIPAIAALVVAAAALGTASDSAIVGGLITFLIGIAIGVVGFTGHDRRFTTWGGGVMASVGALIVAGDVAPTPSPFTEDLDLIETGAIVLAFGVVVIALAWLAQRLLETPRQPVDNTAEPPPVPPAGDDRWAPPGPPN
ncbi:MAG: hypothetical protein ACRDV7_10460 [Acidimicrobiia bacterium]